MIYALGIQIESANYEIPIWKTDNECKAVNFNIDNKECKLFSGKPIAA